MCDRLIDVREGASFSWRNSPVSGRERRRWAYASVRSFVLRGEENSVNSLELEALFSHAPNHLRQRRYWSRRESGRQERFLANPKKLICEPMFFSD